VLDGVVLEVAVLDVVVLDVVVLEVVWASTAAAPPIHTNATTIAAAV